MRQTTDVLIVGGGIAGCMAAWLLAREGVDAIVLEQQAPGAGASGANAGGLHGQIPHDAFLSRGEDWARQYLHALRLMQASIALWQALPEALGCDLEVKVKGGLLIAETDAELAAVARKAEIEREAGFAVRLLDRAALRAEAPYVTPRAIGAMLAAEGQASPLLAVPALVRAARAAGARLMGRTALRSLRREAGGFLADTGAGEISARRVVNAAGADAGRVAALLGLRLPVTGAAIQVAVTEPAAPLVGHLLYHAGGMLTLKQARNGTVLVGGGWPARERPAGRLCPDPRSMAGNLGLACRAVPAIAPLRLVRCWPGRVNETPDALPLLGEDPDMPGLFAACFPWMGFTCGPVTGRITADLLLGRDPGFDLAPFSPARFRGRGRGGT
ncbi:MAG: FAD-binding oxidoreductase [Acetobacteraceae bacterium]|nr:FAD-binding oxidoreductase [Acetobacteraceae bacterium]